MAQKTRGGNRRGGTPKPNRRKSAKKKSAGTSRWKGVFWLLVLVSVCAMGIWQCMGDDAASPLEPLQQTPENIDVGNGKEVDPTLVNESALLKNESLGKPSESELEEGTRAPVSDEQSIEAAGDEMDTDKDVAEVDRFPLYAVSYHFHTQIFEKPEMSSRVLAYARRGATFRVSERVSKKNCPRGWHELSGGGFVCDGTGVTVSKEPVTFEPSPPPPTLNEPLPYAYKYVKRDGVLEYWKIPDAAEIALAESFYSNPAQRGGKSADTDAANVTGDSDKGQMEETPDTAHAAGGPEDQQEVAPPSEGDKESPVPVDGVGEESHAVDGSDSPLNSDASVSEKPAYVHLKMQKGYFVSVSQSVAEKSTTWQRTVRGRYIDQSELYPASPSEFEGVLLGQRMKLPLVFVVNSGVRKLKRETPDGPLKNGSRVARYSAYPMGSIITRNGREYVEIGQGEFILKRAAAIASLVAPPTDAGENERWIDVDLTQQTLVAYEGAMPVFATLISSGREGFETPVGEFRIYSKHISVTMDDVTAGDEAYSIEDVPWTQYFEEGYALHTAFWHDRFGRVRSHGCVNLAPADARRLFFWTGPHFGDGFHGVIATAENPGTRVIIHN